MKWKFWEKEVIREVQKTVYTPIHEALLEFKENPPTPESLKGWKSERNTKYFLALMKAEFEEIKEDMVSGLYTTESSDGTAQLTGKAIGKSEQLRDVIELIEDFGNEREEENER